MMLSIKDLEAGYGRREVLKGINLLVGPGEIVAVIGHNGAGKSTLLKAIFCMMPIRRGGVYFDDGHRSFHTPYDLIRGGVVYIAQGGRVFGRLSVAENLMVGNGWALKGGRLAEAIRRSVAWFPALKDRLHDEAWTLSGGEKQMLALASALTTSPRLLLIDEPSLGLASPAAADVLRHVQRINSECGTSVLIVEQRVRAVLRIAKRVYVLRNGAVSFSGACEELRDETRLRSIYM